MSKVWTEKLRFYFAALGLGFGLGNLWRFPYVVVENGGGAFFFLYAVLAVLVALPILISEMLLGKLEKRPIIGAVKSIVVEQGSAFEKLSGWMGRLSVLLCLLILVYYAIVSGWVMHFFVQFFVGIFNSDQFEPTEVMSVLKSRPWLQVLLASAHLVLVTMFVSRREQGRNERLVGYVIPLFVIILLTLSYNSLTLPSSGKALQFLFYPDFSKLTLSSMAQAIGQLLFTLSVGFGAIVTFGSKLPKESNVPEASLQITSMDVVISLFAGLMIFPLVLGGGAQTDWGPELLFQAVPRLFARLDDGAFFGMLFFICLYVAAMGSSTALLGTVVSNIKTRYQLTTQAAAQISGVLCLILTVIPIGLQGWWQSSVSAEGSILIWMDNILINWLLPLAALTISQVVVYKMDQKKIHDEFVGEVSLTSETLHGHWRFLLKWVVPLLVGLSLILQMIDLMI